MRQRFRNRPSSVFYSISAQEDNLGDIAIRLRLLDWMRETTHEIFVYVGPMSAGYLQPFGLDDRVTIVDSKLKGIKILFKSLLTKRVFLVFPPGPSSFGGLKNSFRSLSVIFASTILSICGGGALQVGASYRRSGLMGAKVHKLKTYLFRLCVVRDSKSFASSRAVVAPDLAFGAWESRDQLSRFRLTISLRSDYELDEQLILNCKRLADANGWRLTFVTQVRRDDERHRELADRYSADLITWDETHLIQFETVQQTYTESLVVLTDRLHGLIFSSNCGALPVALIHSGNDKLTSTFEPVIEVLKVCSGTGEIPDEVIDQIHRHSENPGLRRGALRHAKEELENVRKSVLGALS